MWKHSSNGIQATTRSFCHRSMRFPKVSQNGLVLEQRQHHYYYKASIGRLSTLHGAISSSGANNSNLVAASIASTTALTSNTIHGNTTNNRWVHRHELSMLATAVLASTAATCLAFCEEHDDNDEEVDPYDNLPEQDEPTHCSICLVYRQGPCRPYWRKVEACTKDNEKRKKEQERQQQQQSSKNNGNGDNSNGDTKQQDEEQENEPSTACYKYMMPWLDCAQGHRNLYSLIELDTNYTMGINTAMQEATEHGTLYCWKDTPTVDWTEWYNYIQEHPDWLPNKKAKRLAKKKKGKLLKPLWKRFEMDESDVPIVKLTADVPMYDPQNLSNEMECAFALDQNGQVIGFAYGGRSNSSSANEENEVAKNDDTEPVDVYATTTLKINLIPTHTTNIVIVASYYPSDDEPKKLELDKSGKKYTHVYESRPLSLKKVAKLTPSKKSSNDEDDKDEN